MGEGATLDVSQAALDSISAKGDNLRYGARPLQRVLQQHVLHPLSRMLLEEGGSTNHQDEVIQIRTRAEAERDELEFVTNNQNNRVDKNDIVIVRNKNHTVKDNHNHNEEKKTDDDLLEA